MTDADTDWDGGERRRAPQASPMERHVQTILTVMVAGLVAWVGVTTTQTATDLAVLQERLTQVSIRLDAAIADRYTGAQGRAVEQRIDRLEGRVDRLEGMAVPGLPGRPGGAGG